MIAGKRLEDEQRGGRLRALARRENREARLACLGFSSYAAYIGPSTWREKRDEYWVAPDTPKECAGCLVAERPA